MWHLTDTIIDNGIFKNFVAPASVIVTPLSTSEITVATAASLDSPGVTVYKATVGIKSCDAPATGSAPFLHNWNTP